MSVPFFGLQESLAFLASLTILTIILAIYICPHFFATKAIRSFISF